MKTEDKFKYVMLLCLGMVILKGNKKGIVYVQLDESGRENGNEQLCFALNRNTRGHAGSIYSAEMSGSRIRGIKFISQFEDADRRAKIQLTSKANETELQARLQEKKAGLDDSSILELLRPLRKAYHSTNALGKSALVARVIHFMQKGF